MRVAEELRRGGGTERLRWTTGSWILSEALDAADSAQRRRLESAIDHGDLSWHALPFTLHTEYADPSLLRHGLSLSAELDRRFGRRARAAKATDVPGHTRALVGLLAEAGVDLLHIGVNPVAAVPRVPLQFRWRDGADAHDHGDAPELSVMYQPGGYGDVQVVAGTDVAVAIDLTGDNVGPRSADEVVAAFAALAERFPGAEVVAATLDDVAAVMASARDRLPVVSAEIGDSWIHGVGSDPQKTAGFRALSRLRRDWLDQGRVAVDDPALRRPQRSSLLRQDRRRDARCTDRTSSHRARRSVWARGSSPWMPAARSSVVSAPMAATGPHRTRRCWRCTSRPSTRPTTSAGTRPTTGPSPRPTSGGPGGTTPSPGWSGPSPARRSGPRP